MNLYKLTDFELAVAYRDAEAMRAPWKPTAKDALWREFMRRAMPHITKLARYTSTTALPHNSQLAGSPLVSAITAAAFENFSRHSFAYGSDTFTSASDKAFKPVSSNFTVEGYINAIVSKHMKRQLAAMRNNPHGMLPDDLARVVPLIENHIFEHEVIHGSEIEYDDEGVPVYEHHVTRRRRRKPQPDDIAAAVNTERRRLSGERRKRSRSNQIVAAARVNRLRNNPDTPDIELQKALSYQRSITRAIPLDIDSTGTSTKHDISGTHVSAYLALRGVHSLEEIVEAGVEIEAEIDEAAGVEEVIFNVLTSSLAPLQQTVMFLLATTNLTEKEIAAAIGTSVDSVKQARTGARTKWRETLGGKEGLQKLIEYASDDVVVDGGTR